MDMDLEPFVTAIPSGLQPVADSNRWSLDRETQRDLRERLDALDEHRARAWVSAQHYVITGR